MVIAFEGLICFILSGNTAATSDSIENRVYSIPCQPQPLIYHHAHHRASRGRFMTRVSGHVGSIMFSSKIMVLPAVTAHSGTAGTRTKSATEHIDRNS